MPTEMFIREEVTNDTRASLAFTETHYNMHGACVDWLGVS